MYSSVHVSTRNISWQRYYANDCDPMRASNGYKHALKTKLIVNLTPLLSLMAPKVVITITYDAINDNKVMKMTIFCFQCNNNSVRVYESHLHYHRATAPLPYHQTSSIRRTKFQNSNVSRLVLQLFLLNPLKPCVKSRMKCSWSSAAPITSEWSTILWRTKVRLILKVWRYLYGHRIWYQCCGMLSKTC